MNLRDSLCHAILCLQRRSNVRRPLSDSTRRDQRWQVRTEEVTTIVALQVSRFRVQAYETVERFPQYKVRTEKEPGGAPNVRRVIRKQSRSRKVEAGEKKEEMRR